MRITATALLLAAVALTGCTQQAAAYTVSRHAEANGTGSADLVQAGATKSQARDAIRDYAAGIKGVELYYLKVVTTEDAARYVCRARWYRDATAYDANSDHTARPDAWPYLAITCP
ncbi:hypothetical protein ACGFNY_45295 [Streptomyces chartreusis]|uniref:hypothetical protein n=1 Tax=Streptomyces chartreusis TaxID=1969 RepID=UPI003718CECC